MQHLTINKGLRRRMASLDPSRGSGSTSSMDGGYPDGDYHHQFYQPRSRKTWVEVNSHAQGSGSGSDTGSDGTKAGAPTEEEERIRKEVSKFLYHSTSSVLH